MNISDLQFQYRNSNAHEQARLRKQFASNAEVLAAFREEDMWKSFDKAA